MLISYLSDHKQGPSLKDQRTAIKDAGFAPDKEFVGDDLEHLGLILRKGERDEIVVAHPKAFLGAKLTLAVLEAARRSEAVVTVAGDRTYDPKKEDDCNALVALSAKRWSSSGQTRRKRESSGRPREFRAPHGDLLNALKSMWWNPRTKENPNGASAAQVLEVASDGLGYVVERHHMKYWISDRRERPEDGLANIERKN